MLKMGTTGVEDWIFCWVCWMTASSEWQGAARYWRGTEEEEEEEVNFKLNDEEEKLFLLLLFVLLLLLFKTFPEVRTQRSF